MADCGGRARPDRRQIGGVRWIARGAADAVRPKLNDPALDFRRDVGAAQPQPLHHPEAIRHDGRGLRRVVEEDGQNKRHTGSDRHGALRGQFPFEPEIALEPLLRVERDERDEPLTWLRSGQGGEK